MRSHLTTTTRLHTPGESYLLSNIGILRVVWDDVADIWFGRPIKIHPQVGGFLAEDSGMASMPSCALRPNTPQHDDSTGCGVPS